MSVYGTVELGGTKTLVAVGDHPERLSSLERIPTTIPNETMQRVLAVLGGSRIDSVGVAAFGPVEVREGHPRYGRVGSTPKPGWQGADIIRPLQAELAVPVGLDTDVNGAALGEGRWGAARDLTDYVYITVGTGIGGGVVVRGWPAGGVGHTELGHLAVARIEGDAYPGRCPYHRDCLEGLVSGPALEDRFGPSSGWDEVSEPLRLASAYVAQGVRDLIYTVAPQRVIIGGGVSHIAGFHEAVRSALTETLAGYPGFPEFEAESFVVPPGLGDRSGLAGGLVLAERALGR